MRLNKIFIFYFLFSLCFVYGEGKLFRGKTKEQIIGNPIPMAFTNMVMNEYNILPSQINPQRGTFMIITPDGIVNYLGDFIEFKNSQGFDVQVIPLSEAGETAEAIKTTISNKLSENPMLEYVLLLGDVDGFAAFPSFYYGPENDVSDQRYTYIIGNDNIPDVFIGRFSIDSLSDLAVMMAKTIKYARDPLAYDANWLSRGLIVAGNYANTYPIPITPKWTSYWLMDELLDFGYSQVDTVFYPPVQQGAPYIIPAINSGVGIVNYRGWGDANGWHYPEFHVDDVNDLNNGWLTPVFMSYVCNSNDFANNVDPCFAEAVMRGGTPSVPKGGVAFVGPSDLHTSTKYNNVINAYMYDAILNHDIVELGPAMQAGQSGLIKEFPAQNGPGEAQEFYAHVYNILGDPSLQVYVDTPEQFNFEVGPFKSQDGLLNLTVKNNNGDAVKGAVISVMNGSVLIAKGISDASGKFISTIDMSGVSSLNVYANKGGFIQGHEVVNPEPTNNTLLLSNIHVIGQNSDDKPVLGELVNLTITLENSSGNSSNAFSGQVIFSDRVSPNTFTLDVPVIAPGNSVNLPSIEFVINNLDAGQGVIGLLEDGNGNLICEFFVDVELPFFNISFESSSVTPNTEISPELSISNFSAGSYEDLWIGVSALTEGVTITLNSASDILSSFNPFTTSSHTTNYNFSIEEVAYGSDLTFLIELQKEGNTFFSQKVQLHISPPTTNNPVAPNRYGYWAYDDTDVGYEQTPEFNWVELDPGFGGSGGTHYQLDDDDHVNIELPFTFKYHGINYNQITVSSNGWASFVPCYIDYFWNMSIPMYMGPKALLAPFSDDLETIDTNNDEIIDIWINVYTWFDEEIGRFIIEWSRALNGYDEETEETFQIILHDQSSMPTATGDGVIDFQYLEVEDVDVTKNYSTVGIESPTKSYGLQYVFNNVYAPGAAPLVNERVIRFTTEAPDNYVAPLAVDDQINSNEFVLNSPYPNPFNPVTSLDYTIPITGRIKIFIVDILGREIAELQNGILASGHYKIIWNGTNRLGNSVSSGTYFAVMKYGEKTKVQKLLFLK